MVVVVPLVSERVTDLTTVTQRVSGSQARSTQISLVSKPMFIGTGPHFFSRWCLNPQLGPTVFKSQRSHPISR
jgi:hypothetical protein